jgi:hypothetical protein
LRDLERAMAVQGLRQSIGQLLVFPRKPQQPSAGTRLRLHLRDFPEVLGSLVVAGGPVTF